MPWDSDKSTAVDPDNPDADEQLTADEWDAHVTDGHFPADEVNFDVDGNGDPVMTDPQNADEVIARYDRGEGAWVFTAVSTDDTFTNRIGAGDYHYAGDYDGADADARLDNALSDATTGDTIYLENATYSTNRTVSIDDIKLVGAGGAVGTELDSAITWEINGIRSVVQDIYSGTINLTGGTCTVRGYAYGDVTVSADNCLITACVYLDITFESGTANGLADGLVQSSVTDNGTNTVGDIS